MKELLERFHLNGHTIRFHLQLDSNVRSTLNVSITDSGSERVNQLQSTSILVNPAVYSQTTRSVLLYDLLDLFLFVPDGTQVFH